jgi:hypothetical protein
MLTMRRCTNGSQLVSGRILLCTTAFKSGGVVFAPEVIRHISPIRYANINFRGTFKFPIEKYLVELLGDNVQRSGKVAHG